MRRSPENFKRVEMLRITNTNLNIQTIGIIIYRPTRLHEWPLTGSKLLSLRDVEGGDH